MYDLDGAIAAVSEVQRRCHASEVPRYPGIGIRLKNLRYRWTVLSPVMSASFAVKHPRNQDQAITARDSARKASESMYEFCLMEELQ